MKLYPIRKLVVSGEFITNCYVLDREGKCFIIDPGYEKERIQEYIKKEGLEVIGILLTHAHIDHMEALDCFDVPIYIHEIEYKVLMDDNLNGFGYFQKDKGYDLSKMEIRKINEETKIPLGDEEISVIHCPGHTIGGVTFKIGHDLYTGDTLFEGSVGKWDRPTANLQDLKKSVIRLIDEQPDHMLIHPGHGRSSSIGMEKQINPFYHRWKRESMI
ncbi:MBL fold metallo-hydrolase [Flammeovirga yaeyamensis]|uniref:MBL fold metallo-hydrolase n=1 Tax=Flammeovirga yaeyamensis TaxID=367791 RepID=A0AAX1N311_9BACT|nr:MBL fold metallo-hydrolase [Flammeovirga yaeyamensis]MBB3696028.1 glyoxylase-like metal-dependent hydrolase (beta-lactamase superfamily II) [Flammeovirga yaeyamensis]NMF34714.1 MBL fold metallo-hydrolase [Flammeovirga yaeyamensis]QWG00457.1 MBL fold metallo-hydrolase [Flammeovirga yaeyamensis]